MEKKVALVVGASGLVGSYLVKHLLTREDWTVLGASRGRLDHGPKYRHVALDLQDAESCRAALKDHPEITHVFYAARLTGTADDTIAIQSALDAQNIGLLRNLLDAVEPVAKGLRHVHLLQGNKWYGSAKGPIHTNVPAREDDPRYLAPNPYYAQHDYLVARQAGRSWSWSAIRPGAILGFAPGYPHNLVALVGAYAAICKELGLPLKFPGSPTCYGLIQSGVSAEILCKACVWIAEHEACANQAFNVSNGDAYSWQTLWPRVAKLFGLEPAPPEPMQFSAVMKSKEPVWQALVKRHGLQDVPVGHLVAWEYGDLHFYKTKGDSTSIIRLWKTGFHEFADTTDLFLDVLEEYRAARLLP